MKKAVRITAGYFLFGIWPMRMSKNANSVYSGIHASLCVCELKNHAPFACKVDELHLVHCVQAERSELVCWSRWAVAIKTGIVQIHGYVHTEWVWIYNYNLFIYCVSGATLLKIWEWELTCSINSGCSHQSWCHSHAKCEGCQRHLCTSSVSHASVLSDLSHSSICQYLDHARVNHNHGAIWYDEVQSLPCYYKKREKN